MTSRGVRDDQIDDFALINDLKTCALRNDLTEGVFEYSGSRPRPPIRHTRFRERRHGGNRALPRC